MSNVLLVSGVKGNGYVLDINRHCGGNIGDRVDCIRDMGIQDAAGGENETERGIGKIEKVQRGVCGIRKEDGNFQEAGTETGGEKVENKMGEGVYIFSISFRARSAISGSSSLSSGESSIP